MSKENKPRKKVVVTTSKESAKTTAPKKRTASTRSRPSKSPAQAEFSFDQGNFMWIGIGLALIVLGMLLMVGGGMEDPSQWDASATYSVRRTVLAPIIIVAGLVVEIYAIFKK